MFLDYYGGSLEYQRHPDTKYSQITNIDLCVYHLGAVECFGNTEKGLYSNSKTNSNQDLRCCEVRPLAALAAAASEALTPGTGCPCTCGQKSRSRSFCQVSGRHCIPATCCGRNKE